MNHKESQPLRIYNGTKLHSIGEQNGVHCLDERRTGEEPISQLSPDETQAYYVMLRRFGVPKRDVERTVEPTSIETIRDVVGHFTGMVRPQSETFSRKAPVRQEVTVFRKR